MCFSWLCRLWEKFGFLCFPSTRSGIQFSTLMISGSKEKVLKEMGEPKRVVKEWDVRDHSRTLLQMPQTTMYNITSFMEFFLHFGRKFGMGKTATSQPSSLGLPQYVDSKEAEMLRDLYVVLWTMRERIRELVRRQERRKRRHSRPPICTSSPRGSKQDARSPL
ncbi:LOW QUALITY PROTEIN: sperm acrosome developmental regulator [Notamacropus eugenii]|uniref:LOW QUALITY PROTEIN: sperm acrosome developmental regulator n=1 Tax=Notamacropus eugenii TaxID=9315 RepID=UPI003B676CA9